MPALTSIPLASLRVINHVKDCPTGALVQIASSVNAAVALRVEWPDAGNSLLGIVVLEGAEAGLFLSDDDLGHIPAIDLTEIAEIRVTELLPLRPVNPIGVLDVGSVFHMTDQNGASSIGIAVATKGNPIARRFVHLSKDRRGQLDHISERIYVGKAEVALRAT